MAKQAFPLMSGALESVIYFYEQGLVVGVVTGAGSEGVNSTLKKHGLEKYVSVVVSGDDVENSKPAPDCYLLALKKLGLKSSECIAIEDTYNGSLSAIRANMKCVGVSSSHSVRNLFSKTVFKCSNLDIASQWISQNYQLQSDR
ncbi:MAG: HAD-IA family hydrolase [Alteromonas sp.]|nr:HAD-IA family hydrolase [Alteromonas sp.]